MSFNKRWQAAMNTNGESLRVVFLDIDGVLNGHGFDSVAQSSAIDHRCVVQFNRILRATGAKIVISSAWRYMISGGAMSLKGFEYLLRTHGVHCVDRVIGMTCSDEAIDDRGAQVSAWLATNDVESFVILDDLPKGMKIQCLARTGGKIVDLGSRLVQTHSKRGLTINDASHAITILRRKVNNDNSASNVRSSNRRRRGRGKGGDMA